MWRAITKLVRAGNTELLSPNYCHGDNMEESRIKAESYIAGIRTGFDRATYTGDSLIRVYDLESVEIIAICKESERDRLRRSVYFFNSAN